MLYWDQQRDQRQQHPSQQRFDIYPARLPTHLREFTPIFDLLDIFAQLARPSRREPYSGLVAPLKKARGRVGKKGERPSRHQKLTPVAISANSTARLITNMIKPPTSRFHRSLKLMLGRQTSTVFDSM